MDGVVSGVEGVLQPWGGVCLRVWACLDLCVGAGDGPDQGHSPPGRPAALDALDQAEHGLSQVVARPPRGDFGQGAGRGIFPLLEDAPGDFFCGVVGAPYCPWWGGSSGEHGVGCFDEPLWAGGCCCVGHYVVVPAHEDCTPDLQRGVVAVCWWGGEVVVGGAEAGGAKGGVAGFVRWPVPSVPGGSGLLGVPLRRSSW